MSRNRPNAVLRGGHLAEAPRHLQVQHVDDPTCVLKLFVGNRYEHFEPTSSLEEVEGDELTVFTWSHTTFVAE